MKIKAIYLDGSWVVGKFYIHWTYKETPGTHHIEVIDGSDEFGELIGKKIAVVIRNIKYFILDYKD